MLAIFLFCIPSISSFALSFNGTASAGGDGSNTTASTGGYAISSMLTEDSNRAVGYRFTVINAKGTAQKSCKDMFRYSSYTSFNQNYAGMYKFNTKYPKTYYKDNYTSGSYSTSATMTNVSHDTDYGLALPEATTGLKAWCTNANMGVVLDKFWSITIDTLESNSWAILIEPIFPLKIEGTYHTMTVTEIGVYGTAKFGSGSSGGSSANSNSWGFISNYTNRYMPNALRLTSKHANLNAASEVSSRLSFGSIVTGGYGAAIVYGEYLELKPEIIRYTYYQSSYDGFYVYIQTNNASSLNLQVWTERNGNDDANTYSATSQNNTVRDKTYNWVVYIPKNNHKNEIGKYVLNFTACATNGNTATQVAEYQPPSVTNTTFYEEKSTGLYVYANAESTSNMKIDVWTERNGKDDLNRYTVNKIRTTVNGETYDWYYYFPFYNHNNEMGKYIIQFYVSNEYSELLYSYETVFTPNAEAQLLVENCIVRDGYVGDYDYSYGISYGETINDFYADETYPTMNNKIWFSVLFPVEEKNHYVKQSVWLDGQENKAVTRKVHSYYNETFNVELMTEPISSNVEYILVKARADLLDGTGTVVLSGEVKTFYIPIAPKIHNDGVRLISITGETVAESSGGNQYGSIYYGQKVYPIYEYSSENTWQTTCDFTASISEWDQSNWINASKKHLNEDYDMFADDVYISKNKAFRSRGNFSPYTVPDNSASGNNEIIFELGYSWKSNMINLTETRYYSIPILMSDVELYDIKLVDSDGYVVDPNNLIVGQYLNVYYYYRNNTSCDLYVNGFNDYGENIGVFLIHAYDTICVDGGLYTIPDYEEFKLWGEVYLDGHNKSTEYESNGENNKKSIKCKTTGGIELVQITPNSNYREGTEVITSYWLVNGTARNIYPEDYLEIGFRVYDEEYNLIFDDWQVGVIVPALDKNLIYFKWTVPYGLAYQTVTTVANIINENPEFIPYDSMVLPYDNCFYPIDTEYEEKAPEEFTVPSVPTENEFRSTWWEYECNAGIFTKIEYGVEIKSDRENILFSAAPNATTSDKSIKSGYPISINYSPDICSIDGYNSPKSNQVTDIQYITVKFPEFNYGDFWFEYRTLVKDGIWRFNNDDGYGPVHFTPIYYPNTNYYVLLEVSDLWTPAGMINANVVPNPLKVNGNAYDDWYIRH